MAAFFSSNGNRNHITKRRCPNKERALFLPRFVGNQYRAYENAVYHFLDLISPGYDGGYWEYYTLSNGGFYMSLSKKGQLDIEHPLRHHKGTVSADAASIIVNLYVLCDFAVNVNEKWFTRAFHNLRDYAKHHPEASEIFYLID